MVNLLINYTLIYINVLTKWNYNYEWSWYKSVIWWFWLAIKYTPLHTNLAWQLGRYVCGIYLIASQNPSNYFNLLTVIKMAWLYAQEYDVSCAETQVRKVIKYCINSHLLCIYIINCYTTLSTNLCQVSFTVNAL